MIYPNPAPGGTVDLLLPDGTTGTVKVEIFTVAFRKVQSVTLENVQPGQSLPLPLTDRGGSPLASGLYYVVVIADGHFTVGKLMVLR